jgi:hypothetical protein
MGSSYSVNVGPCPSGFVGWIYFRGPADTANTFCGFLGADNTEYYKDGVAPGYAAEYMHRDYFPVGEFLMGMSAPGGFSGSYKFLTADPSTPLASRPFTETYTASYVGQSSPVADPSTSWVVPTLGNVITNLAWNSATGYTSAMTDAKAPTVRQIYKTAACAKGFIGYYTKAAKSWYGATTTLLVGLHGSDGNVYPLLADGGSIAFTATTGSKVLFKAGEYLVKVCATGGGTKTPKLRLSSAALTSGAALTEVVLDQEIYKVPTVAPACFVAPATQAITKLGYDMLLGKTADMTAAVPASDSLLAALTGNTLYLAIGGGVVLFLLLFLYIRHRRNS